MKIFLDGVDITDDIQAQHKMETLTGGIYPNASTKWFNLLPIIAAHSELSGFFSQGGVHSLEVQDDPSFDFNAKIILRLAYSTRNS